MTEGAVTLNSKGIILYSNSQFAKMVELPLSKVIGLLFEQFIAGENKVAFADLFKKAWKVDCKEEFILQSGETHTPVQLSLTSLELDEGVSLSIILTDLSIHKQIEKELKLKNEQLEEAKEKASRMNEELEQKVDERESANG